MQERPSPTRRLTWRLYNEIALAAEVDARTVKRFLRGESVREVCANRISRTLDEPRFSDVPRPAQPTSETPSTPPAAGAEN